MYFKRPPIARTPAAIKENSKHLISRCCSLGRLQLVDTPTGLIIPTSKAGKTVQVVCRGRPCTPADVSASRLVRMVMFFALLVAHRPPDWCVRSNTRLALHLFSSRGAWPVLAPLVWSTSYNRDLTSRIRDFLRANGVCCVRQFWLAAPLGRDEYGGYLSNVFDTSRNSSPLCLSKQPPSRARLTNGSGRHPRERVRRRVRVEVSGRRNPDRYQDPRPCA